MNVCWWVTILKLSLNKNSSFHPILTALNGTLFTANWPRPSLFYFKNATASAAGGRCPHSYRHSTSRVIKGCYHWTNYTHRVSQQLYHTGCWGEKGINIFLQHILRAMKIKCSPLNHNRSADLILYILPWVNRAAKSQVLKHLIQATNGTKNLSSSPPPYPVWQV